MGKTLLDIRNRLGLTQVDICARLECSQALISQLEVGKLKLSIAFASRVLKRLSLNNSEKAKLKKYIEAIT